MTVAEAKEIVKREYPDVEISEAFARQKDGTGKWMYCAMSNLKFLSSRGKKNRTLNVGTWHFTRDAAWKAAAEAILAQKGK